MSGRSPMTLGDLLAALATLAAAVMWTVVLGLLP